MKLYDPTVEGPEQRLLHAPRLKNLDSLTIGLMCNGKANADVLVKETGALFAKNHGCKLKDLWDKRNATVPAPPDMLVEIAEETDFLITAVGD